MSKFNLKNYKKLNLDEHTEMRLKEQHTDDAPNVIGEAQLEKGRVEEKDVTVEALLEKSRTGGASEVTEKRLDSDKAKFDNKYRNADTAKGNINKLEEQRLKNDPVENEKYEPASEAGKELRWWETKKSPDGLKVAKDQKLQKVAINPEDIEDDDVAFSPEERAINPEDIDPSLVEDPDFDIVDKGNSSDTKSMAIVKSKELTGKIPGIWIVLQYDTVDFNGDEGAIANAAMSKILIERPELSGLVDINDLVIKEEGGDMGEVSYRGIGEEFRNLRPSEGMVTTGPTDILFDETSYNEETVRGTPMAIGQLKLNIRVDDGNRQRVVENAIDFLRELHPNVNVNPRSFDLSNGSAKRIGYTAPVDKTDVMDRGAIEQDSAEIEQAIRGKPAIDADEEDDFPVQEVTASASGHVKEAQSTKKN